jgi:hypothetical protein
MGLFAQQPEEPTEWAGLPDEPLKPRTDAELLADDARPEASPASLLGLGEAHVASIEVDIADAPGAAASGADSADRPQS